MRFHILTLFPDMVMNVLSESITGRAIEKGIIEAEVVNIRDFSADKHKKADDYPYGGGAGMVMQAQPIYDAYISVAKRSPEGTRCIYLTPQGKTFDQKMAGELSREEELIFLCGHYEGVDERVLEEIVTDYVSIGDYVLTGGEIAAAVMVDAISRMIPGVLTNSESPVSETFEGGLLEYPQYSRPAVWRGKEVPGVLLSGDHKKVDEWRHSRSIERTFYCRPELLDEAELSFSDVKEILKLNEEKRELGIGQGGRQAENSTV